MAKKATIKEPIEIPYYVPSGNFKEQLAKSSKRRDTNVLMFFIKKTRNWILQWIAYNCPVNSIRIQLHRWRGVTIGKGVMLGMHCILDNAYPEYIVIEDYAALAGHVYVIAHSNPYEHFSRSLDSYVKPVIIKKGAWIGVMSTLLSGVIVGEYSIITAGSTVTGVIPPGVFARGNPARIVGKVKL